MRITGLLCALGAVLISLVYLKAAGAPSSLLMIQSTAFGFGALLLWAATRGQAMSELAAALWPAAGACAIAATALLGSELDGARRWARVFGVFVQTSLIVMPVALVAFARKPTPVSAAAMTVMAMGLGRQPDRAMAGALLAGLAAIGCRQRNVLVWVPMLAAGAAFTATLAQPDELPPVPFVERILWTAFDLNPVLGVALWMGCLALLGPVVAARLREGWVSPGAAGFGAVWAAIVLAAATGTYPTPLVGYGSSAIIGYLLSLTMLTTAARRSA